MNFELITVADYAKRNNVSRSTTLELIKSGTLDARKVGRSYVVLIKPEALPIIGNSLNIHNTGIMSNCTINQTVSISPVELSRIVKAEVLRVLSGMANPSMN